MALLFCRIEQVCTFCRGHNKEHFCEIILNIESGSGQNVILKPLLIYGSDCIFFSGLEPFSMSTFDRRHHEEYFCEII